MRQRRPGNREAQQRRIHVMHAGLRGLAEHQPAGRRRRQQQGAADDEIAAQEIDDEDDVEAEQRAPALRQDDGQEEPGKNCPQALIAPVGENRDQGENAGLGQIVLVTEEPGGMVRVRQDNPAERLGVRKEARDRDAGRKGDE